MTIKKLSILYYSLVAITFVLLCFETTKIFGIVLAWYTLFIVRKKLRKADDEYDREKQADRS